MFFYNYFLPFTLYLRHHSQNWKVMNHSTVLKYSFFLFGLFLMNACQQVPPKVDMDLEVPNFALLDQNGEFHELYYYGDAKAVVLYTQGNGCSTVRGDMPALKSIRSSFKEKGVEFFMINANEKEDRESILEEAEAHDIEFPILMDKTQLATEALQIHKTGEAILLNPESWTVSYRGPVSNLEEAIEAQFNGELLAENYIQTSAGSPIRLQHPDKAAFENISYAHDVAPIIQEKCARCHVEGGIAPFAMDSYETVEGWSHMIREVLRTKRMPPWHADPHYGVFEDDLSLSKEELQTIVHWIDAGATNDAEEDPLAEKKTYAKKWTLGEPDIVVQLNKEEIPATGILDYRYQELEIDIEEDVWATAGQVIAGNDEVLHHVIVSLIYPDGFVEPIDRRSPWIDGLFMGWAPGQGAEKFPHNTGRILPKGSKLHFQLHYTTNGKAQSDQSTIGIYTTNKAPEKEFFQVGAVEGDIKLLPNEFYENSAKYRFDEEVTLYSVLPHMHYRGKQMTYVALYPNGERETLLNVPNYNFNWQRTYWLKEPKTLPARTVVYVDAVFDNTARNTFNPAPEKTVYFGDYSFDEMLVGFMSFHYGKPSRPDSKKISMK